MPLSTDDSVNKTADHLVKAMRGAFNTPETHRPAHAKGHLLRGTFTPSSEASKMSSAPHFKNESTKILARFSSSTGLKDIPDTDANANPRGFAVRFLLSEDEHKHTDIVAHSTKFSPMRTGEGFLALLSALGNGTAGEFLGANPSAKAFVEDPKPSPESFATEIYYGVNAFKLVSGDGNGTFVRYRLLPALGLHTLSEPDLKSKGPNYLFEELPERLGKGPVEFKLTAQVAKEGDVTDDATVHWPEDREIVELGTIKLATFETTEQNEKEQKRIIFDPIPRVEGVEPSDDPLLDMRAAVYLISGKGRRAAKSDAGDLDHADVA
ncbi:hypothetical protein LTR95_000041 [Oleoguttula sp. CCFEE 5521]